jgi:hypothetical protein
MAVVEATMVRHLMEIPTIIMEVHHLIHTDERNVRQLNARNAAMREVIVIKVVMEEVMVIKVVMEEVMVIKVVMEEVMVIKVVMEEVMVMKVVMEEVMVMKVVMEEVIQKRNMAVAVIQASLGYLFHFHFVSDLIFSQLSKSFNCFYFSYTFGSFCFTRSS